MTINVAQSPRLSIARRRLRDKLEQLGVRNIELDEELRIPAHLEAKLAHYRGVASDAAKLQEQLLDLRPELAMQLEDELNLSGHEIAEFLRVSQALISRTKPSPRAKGSRSRGRKRA